MIQSLPLFDKVFEQGEINRPVKPRSISVSPARRTDPKTSHEAANVPADIRGNQRVKVYLYLLSCGARGATDYEVSVACGMGESVNRQRLGAGITPQSAWVNAYHNIEGITRITNDA